MKKLLLAAVLVALVGLAPCAYAVQTEVHGTLDNALEIYTDQQNFYKGAGWSSGQPLDGVDGQFGFIKYRIWTDMATDDNAVKGVFGVEIGGIRFGQKGDTAGLDTKGGDYSGDGINIETRWAYTDFMLGNGRMKVGLMPWAVNPFVWKETAMGIAYGASAGSLDYTLGWARGRDHLNSSTDDAFIEDADALLGRLDFGIGEGSKVGAFLLYQKANPSPATPGAITSANWYLNSFAADVDMNLYTVGVDGKLQTGGPLFVNWDLMYQNGKIENAAFSDTFSTDTSAFSDFDLNGYFAHLDVGAKLGKFTLTYTGYYASGDDDPTDDEFNAFLATDVDRADSIIFQEGGYTSDNYFTDRPYIADRGLFLNKLAADYQINDKTKVGGAVLYLMTAEDITYDDDNGVRRSDTDLGIELDAYISYKMYKNLTLALNAGYLFAGDAMDVFEPAGERNGSSDEDIFRSTARCLFAF
jgi:hypothetical protein